MKGPNRCLKVGRNPRNRMQRAQPILNVVLRHIQKICHGHYGKRFGKDNNGANDSPELFDTATHVTLVHSVLATVAEARGGTLTPFKASFLCILTSRSSRALFKGSN